MFYFGQDDQNDLHGRADVLGGISTAEDVRETGFIDNVVDTADYLWNNETFDSFNSNWRDEGFGQEQKTSALNVYYEMTGDETFKPNFGPKGGGYSPGNTDSLFRDLLDDSDKLNVYEDYVAANPDSGLLSAAETNENVKNKRAKRIEVYQDSMARNDNALTRTLGSLTGGMLLLADPVVIPSLFFGGGVGGFARTIRTVAIATAVSESIVAYDVTKVTDRYNEEYNGVTNVLLATGLSTLFPIVGKALGRSFGKFKGAAHNYKVNKLKDKLAEMDETTRGELFEVNRAFVEYSRTGKIDGSRLSIHKGSEINLKGLGKVVKGMSDAQRGLASTLRKAVGTKNAKTILNDFDKAGRLLDEDSVVVLRAMQPEKRTLKNLDEYNDFISDSATVTADIVYKSRDIGVPEFETRKVVAGKEGGVADEIEFDLYDRETSQVNASGKRLTSREVVDDIDSKLEELETEGLNCLI